MSQVGNSVRARYPYPLPWAAQAYAPAAKGGHQNHAQHERASQRSHRGGSIRIPRPRGDPREGAPAPSTAFPVTTAEASALYACPFHHPLGPSDTGDDNTGRPPRVSAPLTLQRTPHRSPGAHALTTLLAPPLPTSSAGGTRPTARDAPDLGNTSHARPCRYASALGQDGRPVHARRVVCVAGPELRPRHIPPRHLPIARFTSAACPLIAGTGRPISSVDSSATTPRPLHTTRSCSSITTDTHITGFCATKLRVDR